MRATGVGATFDGQKLVGTNTQIMEQNSCQKWMKAGEDEAIRDKCFRRNEWAERNESAAAWSNFVHNGEHEEEEGP